MGYRELLFLDSATHSHIEEFGSSNFFAIKHGCYITPNSPSVLPSITNKSLRKVAEEFGERYHYFGESRCLGGDEFAEALRSCKEGDVVFFLQHPTWWSANYDLDELKFITRKSVFFH